MQNTGRKSDESCLDLCLICPMSQDEQGSLAASPTAKAGVGCDSFRQEVQWVMPAPAEPGETHPQQMMDIMALTWAKRSKRKQVCAFLDARHQEGDTHGLGPPTTFITNPLLCQFSCSALTFCWHSALSTSDQGFPIRVLITCHVLIHPVVVNAVGQKVTPWRTEAPRASSFSREPGQAAPAHLRCPLQCPAHVESRAELHLTITSLFPCPRLQILSRNCLGVLIINRNYLHWFSITEYFLLPCNKTGGIPLNSKWGSSIIFKMCVN